MWHVDGCNPTKRFGQIGCRKEANASLSSGFTMLLAHQIYEDGLSFQLGTDACVIIWFVYAFMRPYPHHALMNARMQNGEIYNTQQYTRAHDTSIYILTCWLGCFLLHSPTLTEGIAEKFLQTREGSTTCRACPSGEGHPIAPKFG